MPTNQTVSGVVVERADASRLMQLGVLSWPIWEKEPSTFDWHYDEQEICYFLEGQVTVKTKDGEVKIAKGDLVSFPEGLSCAWQIHLAVRKHYHFG